MELVVDGSGPVAAVDWLIEVACVLKIRDRMMLPLEESLLTIPIPNRAERSSCEIFRLHQTMSPKAEPTGPAGGPSAQRETKDVNDRPLTKRTADPYVFVPY